MPIEWRDELSVGVGLIDDDHKHLIAIVNEFMALSRTRPDPAALKGICDRLLDYANRHFEREERLQLLARYAGYEEHKAAHDMLIDTLEAFIERHFIDRREPIDDLAATEMRGFLRTWLIDHILKTDMKMKGKLGQA